MGKHRRCEKIIAGGADRQGVTPGKRFPPVWNRGAVATTLGEGISISLAGLYMRYNEFKEAKETIKTKKSEA